MPPKKPLQKPVHDPTSTSPTPGSSPPWIFETSSHPNDPTVSITKRTENLKTRQGTVTTRSVPATEVCTYCVAGTQIKPLSNPKASCFANTALQLLCWLVHQGPLQFIIDDWNTIKTHAYIAPKKKKQPFIDLIEKLLFKEAEEPPPTPQEVHSGLCQLDASTQDCNVCWLNTGVILSKSPDKQDIQDAHDVFCWLYRCFLFMAGQ